MAEVRLEIDLAHPLELVWRAVTDARLLSEWFLLTDLEPRVGWRFTLYPGAWDGFLGPVAGELTELVPRQRVVMLWQGEQLYTRVVWELAAIPGGCQLRLVQSGFLGTPGTVRRRALRATYTTLLTERLPETLERLARDGDSLRGAGRPARPAVVPRQWTPAGVPAPPVGPAGAPVPDPPSRSGVTYLRATDAPSPRRTPARPSAASAGGGPVAPARPAGPVDAGADPAGDVTAVTAGDSPAVGSPRPVTARWRAGLAAVPAWSRALVTGAAAAIVAVALLGSLSQTSPPRLSPDGQLGPPEAREGPGTAVQPGTGLSRTDTAADAGQSSVGAAGTGPDRPDGPQASGTPSAGPAPGEPWGDSGDAPEEEPAPETESAADEPPPELTAQFSTSTSGLLGLDGRAVTVTVTNPGPGDADGWEVTMDVGDQEVTNLSGASYERDGTRASFTPVEEGLAAGEDTEFSFHIPSSGLLGLGGADDPTDCRIDGNPCD